MCPPSLYLSLFHTPSSSCSFLHRSVHLSSSILSFFPPPSLSFLLSYFSFPSSLSSQYSFFQSFLPFRPLSFQKMCSGCLPVQLLVLSWSGILCPFWAQLFLPGSISVLCCLPLLLLPSSICWTAAFLEKKTKMIMDLLVEGRLKSNLGIEVQVCEKLNNSGMMTWCLQTRRWHARRQKEHYC